MAKQSVKPATENLPKPPASEAPLIDWALWHHDHGEAINGYWITPIRPGEKAAYKKDWSKKPLKTRAAVERHWEANPDDNIGLVPRPGHFWLDADDLDVLDKAEDEHGQLPHTYTQRSINGSLHFLFQNVGHGDVTTSPTLYFDGKKLGEIRGALSGQCVAAGSRGTTREGEPGAWEIEELAPPIVAPDWVFDLIKGSGKATLKDVRKDYGEPIYWDREQAKRLVEAVWYGKRIKDYEGPFLKGERDKLTFQLFAEAKNRIIHPDVMLEAVKGCGIDGGLEDVVERKMQSAYHDGSTQDSYGSKVPAYWLLNNPDPANRFYAVKFDRKGNRLPPPPPDDPVEWKAANPNRLPKAFPGDPEPANDDAPVKPEGDAELPALCVQSFAQLLVKKPQPVAEIIPDRIEKGVVNFLSGPGGSHKSRLALQYCLCIGAREPIFGMMPAEAMPIYICAEDDEAEIIRRMHKLAQRLDVHPDAVRETTGYLDRTNRNNALVRMRESGDYELTPFYNQLGDYVTGLPGHKFVVLDSCYDFVRFEGSAKVNEDAVNVFVKVVLGGFCRDTNSTLLVTWHPSYAGQERGDGSGWSVAWHNAPRVRDQIKRMGQRRCLRTHRREAEPWSPAPTPHAALQRRRIAAPGRVRSVRAVGGA